MAYIVFHTNSVLNEDGTSGMTANALKAARITSVEGFGGESIPVNGNGYLVDPAKHLPNGMLDNLKNAWSSSGGDVNAFYNQTIDGTKVSDILKQCPSQQSYGIAKELGLPDGTSVPCKEFTDKGYNHIKYNSSSSSAGGSAADAGSGASGADAGSGAIDAGAGAGDGSGIVDPGLGGNWWAFFGSKQFLIGAAAFAGVLAAIKALGNTIKARFRKCAKVLYTMQKDFGTSENGLDMKAVLPGVGSGITSWITRLWGTKKGTGKNKGAIGLRPFVDNYRNEIASDYAQAQKAFTMISAAGDSSTSGEMNNLQKPNESVSEHIVYESFAEALNNGKLNESEQLNEFALGTAIAAGSLALSTIVARAGSFKFKTKDADGKEVEKEVKVTPRSVREICYSILNVFYGKYFDLERVFKGLGIDDLSDVNSSNVDKFKQIVKKSSETIPAGGKNKMYLRVEKNYNEMVDAYVRIGQSIINNFEKFTKKRKGLDGKEKQLSEKDSNLLVAAKEKLQAELNRQKDGYKNNFARVMNAIISSKEYIEFTNFVIEEVLPVFKSGEAGDADYILDILPKKDEYFVLRQTNNQPGLETNDTAQGNAVLVRVTNVENEGQNSDKQGKKPQPKITFVRIGLLTNPGSLTRTDKMEYDFSGYDPKNIDKNAFSKEGTVHNEQTNTLDYNKWLALDPTLAINVSLEGEEKASIPSTAKVYKRTKEQEQYIIVTPSASESTTYNESQTLYEEGEEKAETPTEQSANQQQEEQTETPAQTSAPVKNVIFVNGNRKTNIEIQANDTTEEKVNAVITDQNNNMGFTEVSAEEAKNIIKAVEQAKEGEKTQIQSAENLPDVINKQEGQEENGQNNIAADEILKNIDTISNNIAQTLGNIKAEDFNVVQGPAGTSIATYKNGKAQLSNIVNKQRQFNSILPFDTGVSTSSRKKIFVAVQPRLYAKNNITADLILVTGDGTSFDEIKFRGSNKDTYASITIPADINAVKQEVTKLVNYYKANPGKYTIEESDITVEYDKYFNIAESFMSSFGMTGANKLHVNRTIKAPKNKYTYYALSENTWGDGSKLDPEKYLKESLDNMLNKYNTFDELAKLAKNSHSINLIKIAEDCSYNTAFPYNRYQMLTASNPLYEGLVIVRFDSRGNLIESIRTGIKKIYCETV